jgi:uncharacterized membrane protein YoaK (UPF0700 family)
MAASIVPARRTEIESRDLEPVSFRRSFAPDSPLLANPQSLIRERRADDRVAIALLSGTGGYIDAVGFLTLVGMFPSHVTGEIVGLTTVLSAGHHLSHPSRLAIIPTFVLALFVAALVARSRKLRGKSATPALFTLIAASLALCTATGFFGPPQGPASFTWAYALREGSMVAAMAFQSALRRDALANACPTTVMTGNLMQLVYDLVDAIAARFAPEQPEQTHARQVFGTHLKLMASAVGSFVVGALLGGYLTGVMGAFSVAVPLVATLVAARRFT